MVEPPPFFRVAPLFVVLLFLCSLFGIAAQSLVEASLPATVVDIEFLGVKRTRQSVLDRYVPFAVGDTVTEEDLAQATQSLRESDLFAEVLVEAVTAGEDSVAIRITLDEKWTLLPFPLFFSSGGRFSGGLVLIESNVLGFDKQLVAVGIAGNTGFSTFFLYDDPAVLQSRWHITLANSLGATEIERTDAGGATLWSREAQLVSLTPRIGYRVSDAFEPSVAVSFDSISPRSDDAAAPDFGQNPTISPQAELEFDNQRLGKILYFGLKSTARAALYSDTVAVDAEIEYSFPVAGLHRIRLLAAGGAGDRPVLSERPISGSDGYRSLPSETVFADNYATGALFADIVVVERGWGAVTLNPFWETGYFETERAAGTPFYGPGAGLRVYIKQVAIPALGVDIAYNLLEDSTVFSVAVGMGM